MKYGNILDFQGGMESLSKWTKRSAQMFVVSCVRKR